MFDDVDRLRNNRHLLELLAHYSHLGEANVEAWQNRVMQMDGVEPPDLVKLHGELIAFGWADQNTGEVPICYRITSSGQRALRQAQVAQDDDAELPVTRSTAKGRAKKAA